MKKFMITFVLADAALLAMVYLAGRASGKKEERRLEGLRQLQQDCDIHNALLNLRIDDLLPPPPQKAQVVICSTCRSENVEGHEYCSTCQCQL
ncbi:hypothetical protein SAMN05421823_111165 [Catalinimonas alkaloidigena]|uniref:Uncharacterized protein n=1 Tax=Catalinimonas alkaloidigena TaxID=1075417 RepID=A0A1G9RI14_9BACT|nr:hypothetical protein [Catalinimonas alkaloidigena]SDM22886.1 hypothetical protein SAMN05421823_111165 [Catalinimonas alkaloidigena]